MYNYDKKNFQSPQNCELHKGWASFLLDNGHETIIWGKDFLQKYMWLSLPETLFSHFLILILIVDYPESVKVVM